MPGTPLLRANKQAENADCVHPCPCSYFGDPINPRNSMKCQHNLEIYLVR